jgi:hypothetical protein
LAVCAIIFGCPGLVMQVWGSFINRLSHSNAGAN